MRSPCCSGEVIADIIPRTIEVVILANSTGTATAIKKKLCEKLYVSFIYVHVLPLHIETGRYRNLKVEERLCKVCDLKTVENELHFVFDCPTYSQLRLVYYNWIIKIYPDFLILYTTSSRIPSF